jgi:hypothetical protein
MFIMKKVFGNLLRITVLATILSLTGLVMSGAALAAEQCVDNKDGTVTDNTSHLMWQQATAGPMNWNDAMSYAASRTLGGKTGWRLPNRDELPGLYRSPCLTMMSVRNDYYWSSTTPASLYAWLVHFYYGTFSIDYKSSSYYVRAVRAGQ